MAPPDPNIFDWRLLRDAVQELRARDDIATASRLCDWIEALMSRQVPQGDRNTREVVNQAFRDCLSEAGITSGTVAELGGPYNSDAAEFPEFQFEWLSLFPANGYDTVRVCNICDAEHVESEQYDAILSVSVMEHVAEPWKAARHMERLVKPGGIVFHAAPFSYYYHGAPADYWRYTPDAFTALFPTLRPMMGRFHGGSRRRDNRGTEANPVDLDGGPEFSPDAFGGWRESWFTIYCGQKDPDYALALLEQTERQYVIDLMRMVVNEGNTWAQAGEIVAHGLSRMEVGPDRQLRLASGKTGMEVTPDNCVATYRDRTALGLDVSYNSHPTYARFKYLLARDQG